MVIQKESPEGSTAGARERADNNQKHDLLVTFVCPDQWFLHYNTEGTEIYDDPDVDPETCKEESDIMNEGFGIVGTTEKSKADQRQNKHADNWGRVRFVLLSMMVSGPVFAGYNITTFYVSVVLVAGNALRPNFLFNFWKGLSYEQIDPDAFIKLIEACYMKRHEEDLIGEEETYRMIQEIVRSPELFKALAGSSLKGATDPKLDKLSEEQKKQLEHLANLEKKQFDVAELRDEIMKKGTGAKDDLLD